MTPWRFSVVVHEMIGNAKGSWRRHLVFTALTAFLICSMCTAEAGAASRAIVLSREMERSGRNVLIITAPDSTRGPVVPAASCDSLNMLGFVRAAGGLRTLPLVSLEESPGTPVRPYGSTGSVARVLDPTLRTMTGGGLISRELATQLGVRSGETISLLGGAIPAIWFEPSARHPLGPVLVLVPDHAPMVDECWIEVDAAARDTAPDVALAILASPGNPLVVRSALDAGEYTRDPLVDFMNRSSRWIWLIVGFSLALPIVIGVWVARGTVALYRTLGAGRGVASCIYIGEALWVMVTGAGYGVASAAIILQRRGQLSTAASMIGLRATYLSLGMAVALVCTGVLLLARGSVVEQLRDR